MKAGWVSEEEMPVDLANAPDYAFLDADVLMTDLWGETQSDDNAIAALMALITALEKTDDKKRRSELADRLRRAAFYRTKASADLIEGYLGTMLSASPENLDIRQRRAGRLAA
jgi:hypothetical protein